MNTAVFGNPVTGNNSWLDRYLLIVFSLSIVGFLSIKGCTNLALVLLLIPALREIKPSYLRARANNAMGLMLPILITLAMPILAILISQTLRLNWIFKAYDGPMRIFLAIPLIIYFTNKKIDFAKLIGFSAPIALLILVPLVLAHPEISAKWADRFATSFVDPNTLGTYTQILTAFCLFGIGESTFRDFKRLTLPILGMICGLYLMAGSGTRGSLLAMPVLFLLWIHSRNHRIKTIQLIIPISIFILALVLAVYLNQTITDRITIAYDQIVSWFHGVNPDTSVGLRLSMWEIAVKLFLENPIYGYGDNGFANVINNPAVVAISTQEARNMILNIGPHNEILANLLRSGFFGGVSMFCLYFIPLKLFWSNRKQPQASLACYLGLAFVICLFFSGLSLEVLTLKYTTTFYGLIMAGLCSEIIRFRVDNELKT